MNKKRWIQAAIIVISAAILFSVVISTRRDADVASGKHLNKVADRLNRDLPMMVDKETEWVSTAGMDGVIIYNYRLVNYGASDVLSGEFVKTLRPALLNSVCTTPETRDAFLKKNINMRYIYNDKNYVHIATIEIAPKDCGF